MIEQSLNLNFSVFLLAAAVAFLVPPAGAQTPSTAGYIQNLGYSVQGGNRLYVTGTYQGKPAQMVRTGAPGKGSWAIYTGTVNDRVRLTFLDGKGLQDILAMDKGYRITLNSVGEERVEYRLYGPDRKFVIGSVLFRDSDKRWKQGLMKSEAFPGYVALIDVADISDQIEAQVGRGRAFRMAGWYPQKWRKFELISPAVAQEDAFLDDFMNNPTGFFSAPGHEILKATVVAAAAFTVRLVASPAARTMVGGVLVTAAPVMVAVGAGVAIALAADQIRDWATSRNLGNPSSIREVFQRLTRTTTFSETLPPTVPVAITNIENPSANSQSPGTSARDVFALTEQLDRLDQLEFKSALDAAEACRHAHKFDCAASNLNKAQKFANRAADKRLIDSARIVLGEDIKQAAEEAKREELRLARAEQQRQLALMEQRRQAQSRAQAEAEAEAERARRRVVAQEAERQSRGGDIFGRTLFGALGVGIIGSARGVLSEDKVRIAAGFVKDVMTDGQGQNIAQAEQEIRAGRAAASPSSRNRENGTPGSNPAPVANASWHEDLTNREHASGKVTRRDNYSRSISGEIISGQMGSQSAAQAFWGPQGGTVVSYSGCGACGVGSTITVVVRYSSITDTHVFTRDR